MRLRSILTGLLILSAGTLVAQKNSDVLFSINNEPVTVEEFKYIYEKNNAGDSSLYSDKSLKEYLNLYVNFKLKVKEAREMGLDTTQKFKREFNNYRDQLAQPYLTDRNVTQSLIDEAYERMKYEIRASHILLMVSPDAAPKDTLEAYKQIMKIRERALGGEDFSVLARESSKDPSVANNGGDLGYFTVFHMIYPFENAAYALNNPGDISMPVRTRFGYHIIKLADKRPYRGEIKVRHILITSQQNANDPENDGKFEKAKIDSLYSLLQQGVPFEDLAKQYSEHQSKSLGGELPPFNSFSNYPEEFKNAAFELKNDGDYSKPIKSSFGWHLVQRISKTGLQGKSEMTEYLKQRIAKDSRSEKSMEAAIANFKQKLNYTEKKNTLKKFSKLVDTSLLHGNWAGNPKAGSDWMFKVDDKQYTMKDFADYLKENQEADRYTDLSYALKQYFTEFSNESVYNYENQHLEQHYPEFKNIVKEYREGIVLFDITDQKVWSKAIDDSTGLKEYFEKNRDKYRWAERADAVIIDLRDASAVKDIKAKMAKGASIEDIADAYKKDPLSFNYKKGLFEKKDNPVLEQVKWAPGTYELGLMDGRYYVIRINEIKAPANKELNEVKGMAIADYQDYLEKQWLTDLKNKYKVNINQDVIAVLTKK